MVVSFTHSADRRLHRRLTADAWPQGIAGRLRPGHRILIVNLSATGALIETARRLMPGGSADLYLETDGWQHATRVSIVRCQVSGVRPDGIIFRSGLSFERGVPWLEGAAVVIDADESGAASANRSRSWSESAGLR